MAVEIDGDATHDWFLPKVVGYQCCRKCGVVRRYDHKNKPCEGQVRVGLRDEYTEETNG